MSTKPATVGTWDSGLVNTIAITAGHGTNGYIANEVPTSAEVNKVFNLAGLWEQYLSDANLQGAHTIDPVTALTAFTTKAGVEAQIVPQSVGKDYSGKAHAQIDHLGFRGGQLSEWEEHWRAAAISSDWTIAPSPSTAVPTDPSASFTQRSVSFTIAATSNPAPELNSQYLNFVDNDAICVMESMVRTPTALQTGSSSDTLAWGVRFSNGGGNNSGFQLFYSSASANWRCRWVAAGAAVTNTDSTIVVATSTNYRFRIELVGSNNSSAAANTMTARFFINGALVATITVAAWTSDKARLSVHAVTLPTENYIWLIGRMRYQFAHLLTQDNL